MRSIVENQSSLSNGHLESLAVDFELSSHEHGMLDDIQDFRCAVSNLNCIDCSVGKSEVGGLDESSSDVQDRVLVELKISSDAQNSIDQNLGSLIDDHVSSDDDSVGTGKSTGNEFRSLGHQDVSGSSDVSIDGGEDSLDQLDGSNDGNLGRSDVSSSNGEGGVLKRSFDVSQSFEFEDISVLIGRDGSSVGEDGSIVDGIVSEVLSVLDGSVDDESSAVVDLGCKEGGILDKESGSFFDVSDNLSLDGRKLGQSSLDGQRGVGQDLSTSDDDLIGSSIQSSRNLVQDDSSIVLDVGSNELGSLDDELSLVLN